MIRFLETPDDATILGKRDRAVLELLYATGCRVAELAGINLEDLDFKRESVLLRGKGRKERIVPFGSKAREALHAYIDSRDELLAAAPEPKRDNRPLFLDYQGAG